MLVCRKMPLEQQSLRNNVMRLLRTEHARTPQRITPTLEVAQDLGFQNLGDSPEQQPGVSVGCCLATVPRSYGEMVSGVQGRGRGRHAMPVTCSRAAVAGAGQQPDVLAWQPGVCCCIAAQRSAGLTEEALVQLVWRHALAVCIRVRGGLL
jgi:hypothetical protein